LQIPAYWINWHEVQRALSSLLPIKEKTASVAFENPQPASSSIQAQKLYARVTALTDVGQNRRHNEDSHLILPLDGGGIPSGTGACTLSIQEPGLLLAVADGMGGHLGGEVASSKCVENLASEIFTRLHSSESAQLDLASILQQAVEATHQAVFTFAREYAKNQTMGTTLTAALVCGTRADLAQVGDSRAYLFREGNLVLLTQDQTIGNQLRNRGADPSLLSAQIQEYLTQAVGAQRDVKVAMTAVDLEPGDLLLLCSDGLYKAISPEEFLDILEIKVPPAEKAAHLVARANENGGPDNITVILAEICQVEAAG
jgi:serine/threonine protein phosphatase PrpC